MQNTRVVYVMVGPPGSGKTTYRSSRPELKDALVISPDDHMTNEEGQYEWTGTRASAAWKKCYQRFGLALRRSEGPIVWDATFGTVISRSAIVNTAKGFGYEVEAIVMQTPMTVCLARNARRTPDRRVPEDTLRRLQTAETPTEEEGFDRVEIVGP